MNLLNLITKSFLVTVLITSRTFAFENIQKSQIASAAHVFSVANKNASLASIAQVSGLLSQNIDLNQSVVTGSITHAQLQSAQAIIDELQSQGKSVASMTKEELLAEFSNIQESSPLLLAGLLPLVPVILLIVYNSGKKELDARTEYRRQTENISLQDQQANVELKTAHIRAANAEATVKEVGIRAANAEAAVKEVGIRAANAEAAIKEANARAAAAEAKLKELEGRDKRK